MRVLKREKKMTDLPIKDLQSLRAQYVDQREDVKKSAELEERDLTDTDVASRAPRSSSAALNHWFPPLGASRGGIWKAAG